MFSFHALIPLKIASKYKTAMEEFKPIVCIVCLKVINNENCSVIEETIKNVLDILHFKRPVEISSSMICDTCYTKVFEAFEFKTVCTDTEDSILPYVNSSNGTPVDLKEICAKEKVKEQFRSVLKNERICRLCLQTVASECMPVRDLKVDLICKYIPEVNFSSTGEPIICMGCIDSLKTHGSFLKQHFGVYEFQNISKEEATEDQFYIKTEEIELKSEQDDQDTDTIPPTDQSTVCKAESEDSLKTLPLKAGKYKCDTCAYESTIKRNLTRHRLKHKNVSEVPTHKCDRCNFIAKRKDNLANHQIVHEDLSKLQIYNCDVCDFETKYKKSLADHLLRHKDVSEIRMYVCDKCSYKTKYKSDLVKHQLKHKDVFKLTMYMCDICNYGTKYKSYLRRHQLKHKDVSEIQLYKCDVCSFETKYKGALARHQRNTQIHCNLSLVVI